MRRRQENQYPGQVTQWRERFRNRGILVHAQKRYDRHHAKEKPPGSEQCGVNADGNEKKCGDDALHCEETAISSISMSSVSTCGASTCVAVDSPPKRRSRF